MTATTEYAEPTPPLLDANDATNNARPYFTNHKTATELGWQQPRKRDPLLDRPSERVPLLDRLMDSALTVILLTADGSTTSLAVKVSGGSSSSRAPVSGLVAELDELGERYTSCSTHRARLRVIAEAQALGYRLRFAPDRSKVQGTVEWRAAIVADSRSCRELESVYGVGYRTIARIKKAAKSGDSSPSERERAA